MTAPKLQKGESKRKDGRFMYRHTDAYGKRRTIYAKTLVDLRIRERQIARDQAELDNYVTTGASLNFVFGRYIALKTNLKQNTRTNYIYMYDKFIRESLGKKNINEIKYSDIKQFYVSLLADGLQVNTLDNIHTVLHPTLQMAVRDNVIRSNPSDGVMAELKKNDGRNKGIRHALTLVQQRAFLNYTANSPVYCHWLPLFSFLFGTGCRIGEAIGIRWEDVNIDKKEISVNHALEYMLNHNRKAGWHVSTPKTPAGIRMIPLLKDVEEAIIEEQENQKRTGIYNIDVIDGMSGFIFSNRYGKLLNPSSVNRAIARISDAYNAEETVKATREKREPVLIPHFSAHHIRHTFATRLCEHESNLKVIQSIMGHADIATTMNIYAEATKDRKVKTAEMINNSDSFF